ncbi:MAG TPA: glycosyltransferase family 9 protein [Bacteroidota bacterium]|nr:glycosyltransferase family 9 protein [Bacteroidota bacterium]
MIATLCTFSYIACVEQFIYVDFHSPTNILVVRTDRIGDVILSLPMVSALRAAFPTARISMLLRSYTMPLAENYAGLDQTMSYDEQGIEKPFRTMLKELRQHNFDAVVVSYPTLRLALLMFLSRIPLRIGTGYRWYSFFFNKRIYEHRKTAEKHESEYNISLLRALGISDMSVPLVKLEFSQEDEREAQKAMEKLALSSAERVVVLHPGSGGSARDWSPDSFARLAQLLEKESYNVVVSGGPGEAGLVRAVIERSGTAATAFVGNLNLKQLAAFLRQVDLFVSNSTGPLHIAAVVGTPVIGLYPPIRECSPARWGPLSTRKRIFVPNAIECPRCKGSACRGNDCMDLITPEMVFEAAKELLTESHAQRRVMVS